jgi:hypothetical protein
MRRNFGLEALTGVDETNTAPCRWKKKRPARGRLLLDYYFFAALRVFRFFFIAMVFSTGRVGVCQLVSNEAAGETFEISPTEFTERAFSIHVATSAARPRGRAQAL